MRSRAIVIVLLVALALLAMVSVGSAGTRAVSPILISAHGAQNTGLIWGGGGSAPAPPARLRVGSQGSTLIDILIQITRPISRRFPGAGWWGDQLQID